VEHGVTGLLSPEGDADALARNIEELLSHPERWAAMGRRGRERMERRYGLVRLAPELARHYHSIAAGESGAPAAANEP
jgi:colanic acid/amylovoran biosynthesis glycosyltransferase